MLTKNDKRAAAVAASLVVIGVVAVVSLTLCAAAPIPARSMIMGYSTGPELFNGMCKNTTNVVDCTNCCLVNGTGMPVEEREKCIDLCIDKFGAASTYEALVSAAKTVREVSTSDYVHYCKSRNLIKQCRHSVKYPRVRALANSMARELNLLEPAHL